MRCLLPALLFLCCTLNLKAQTIQPVEPVNICGTGSTVLNINGAPNGATFQWQKDGADISGAVNASYTATSSGSYAAVITNAAPPQMLAAIAVSITPKPVADFTFTPNTSICADVPVTFKPAVISGTPPYTYSWDFGDGSTSAVANPAHPFVSLGCGTFNFIVKLTVTDARGCTSTVSKTITVLQSPDVQLSDPANLLQPFDNCNNDPSIANPNYTITANNISPSSCITSYSMDWGDGQTAAGVTFPLTHTYTSLGVFSLKVTAVGSNGCSHTKTYVVANQKNPDIGIGTYGPTEGCANLPIKVVISLWSTNSPGTTYLLEYGDGSSVAFTHPINPAYTNDTTTHIYTTTSCPNLGVYSIKVTATNACRSKSFTGGDIVVKIKPQSDFTISKTPVCIGQSVCFQNTTKSGYDVNCNIIASTQWDFGDPSSGSSNTSSLSSPCHIYNTAGVYTVTLTTTNVCGPSVVSHTVCVTPPPVPGFTVDQTAGCSPLVVNATNTTNFFNACAAPTYKWRVVYKQGFCSTTPAWAFANGTTDSSASPSFSFVNGGTYTITMFITSACGIDSLNKTIVVKQKPLVSINPLTAVCARETISPSAVVDSCSLVTPLQYNWVFTDGIPATANTLMPGNIAYTLLGSHPVQLSVTNECGVTTSATTINITSPPVANAGADKVICSRANTSIGAAAVTGFVYQWQPVTGLSSPANAATNVTLVYNGINADTTYTYIVTVWASSNCSSSDTVQVTVKKKPAVTVNPATAETCAGGSVQLVASGAASYAWAPSAGLSSASKDSVTATPAGTTTYQVIGIAANSCADTASVVVSVKPYPNTNAGKDTIVCNNTSAIQLTGSPSGGAWSGVGIAPTGVFNPAAAGNGNYILYYTAGLNQCIKTDSLLVMVIKPPVAIAGADTTVCLGKTSFTLVGSPAGGSWSGNALVAPSGTFTPSAAGTYNVVYTYGSGSCISKDTLVVMVDSGITNNIISPNQSVCVNVAPNQITGQAATGGNGTPAYQWQMGTDSLTWANITGETGINYIPPVISVSTFYRRLAFTSLCFGTSGSFSNPVKITVRQDAKAVFTASPVSSCAPFNLANAVKVTPYPAQNGLYQWYADGILIGSNGAGVFPTYAIPTPDDTVRIKLVTTSQYGCKADSAVQQFITVRNEKVSFTKDTASGCGPLRVKFTNTSSILNGVSFTWNFGNGTISNTVQPGVAIFNAGPQNRDTIYAVTLKAFNGCDTTFWRDSIKIRANPKARFGVDTTAGCSPFPIHITNTSLGGPNTYYWDFGNGHRDTTYTNGTLDYLYNTGNFVDTFKLQLIAANECKRDTQVVNIRIAPNNIKPGISINGNDLFGCAPHIVAFNNSTTGATLFTWAFGDGSPNVVTSNGQSSVVHTFGNPGTYAIQVLITNGCSDTVISRSVTVYNKPVAAFTTNAVLFCQGDNVTVNNTSQNATNYFWNWGDGQTSTGINPVHAYTASGNYTIYLRAEKANNSGVVCYDTIVKSITVSGKPDVRISSNVKAINCTPFTLTVNAPGIINETASWYFYDSSVSPSLVVVPGTTAQYTFKKPGTFYVKLLAKNAAGCTDSALIPFTVYGNPVAGFTPGNTTICKTDTTIAYINATTYNGIDPIKYNWLVDGISLSANGNFTYQYTVGQQVVLPRNFTTQLIVSNTIGCSDTADAILQMAPNAKAQFSIGNPNNCVPFVATVTNNSAYTTQYKWLLNGVPVSTGAAPIITITKPLTVYTITLIAGNGYGCKPDTTSFTFTSRVKPIASFSVNDTLGCTGILNVATNNTTINASSYAWDWGDNSAGSAFTSPSHLYTIPGEYKITLTAGDGVCRDTVSQSVKVSIKPVTDFTANTTVTCDTARVQFINQTLNGNSYLWDFGDGTFSMLTNPSKSFAPSALPYTVKLTAYSTYGCKDSAVKPNLVLAKVPPGSDFFISPTPVITIPNYTFSFNNLTLNSTSYQYLWSLGDGTFAATRDVLNHKYADTGSYPVRLIVLDTATNCADTTLKIARITGFPGWMFIPNAICPNCMQENLRTFLPKGTGLKTYHLQIFTTWGELIFESTSLDNKGAPNQAWDGKYKGSLVLQDVYVWKIQATFKNGTEWLGMIYPGESKYKKAGSITVVK